MLLRICLILAILCGIGVIGVSQWKMREHIQGIIDDREKNGKDRDDWHNRFNKSQKTLEGASNTLVATIGKLGNTEKELETTKANLEGANNAKESLTADLKKAKDATVEAQTKLSKWEQLGMTPEQAQQNREDLRKSVDAIAVYETEKQILIRDNQKKQAQIDFFTLGKTYEPPMPGVKGKVLVVDAKWGFVVLDVGDKQGALQNGVLLVQREGKLVGKVKISNVLPERSVANVVQGQGWTLPDVREGDQVIY